MKKISKIRAWFCWFHRHVLCTEIDCISWCSPDSNAEVGPFRFLEL